MHFTCKSLSVLTIPYKMTSVIVNYQSGVTLEGMKDMILMSELMSKHN